MSKSKHKVLKELLKTYNDRTYDGTNYTEEGKSLSTEEIHRRIKSDLDITNVLLSSLHYHDYIKKTCLKGSNSTFWLITDKGRDALSEKRFLWYYNHNVIFNVINLLFALAAFIISIIALK